MKAEELQVGNWVNFPNKYGEHQYFKISGIEKSKNKSTEDIDQFYFEVPPGSPSCGTLGMNLKPIPITPEILERNGIEKVEDSILYDWRHSTLQNGAISCFKDPNKDWNFDMLGKHLYPRKFRGNLKFVHELQQLIKNCGIDKEIEL